MRSSRFDYRRDAASAGTPARRKSLATCAGLVAVGILTSTCSSSKPVPVASTAPKLWGDLKPVVSVKELMRDMIDPLADNIFDAVGTEITAKGTVETAPKRDEDWAKVRIGAVTLAEGVYLLKIPRPFAPPGDENNSTGPDAPELSPAQIHAKLDADPVLWNAKIEALRNVGLEVLEIVQKKDVNALFEAAGDLDAACEGCHIEFWYPGEKTLLPKLRRRLEELYPPESRKPIVSRQPTPPPVFDSAHARTALGDRVWTLNHDGRPVRGRAPHGRFWFPQPAPLPLAELFSCHTKGLRDWVLPDMKAYAISSASGGS